MRPVNRARIIQRTLDKVAGLIEAERIRDGLVGFEVFDQLGFKHFPVCYSRHRSAKHPPRCAFETRV